MSTYLVAWAVSNLQVESNQKPAAGIHIPKPVSYTIIALQ